MLSFSFLLDFFAGDVVDFFDGDDRAFECLKFETFETFLEEDVDEALEPGLTLAKKLPIERWPFELADPVLLFDLGLFDGFGDIVGGVDDDDDCADVVLIFFDLELGGEILVVDATFSEFSKLTFLFLSTWVSS